MNYTHIDIHTHLNINAFADDWKEVLLRTHAEGVAIINVGTQRDTSERAIELAEMYEDGVYGVVGLHPTHTCASHHDSSEFGEDMAGFTAHGEELDIETYKKLAAHPKVVAIGECGLDYFRLAADSKEKQKAVFIEQIKCANELGKPLMLHIRASEGSMDAYEDALVILKEHAKVRGNVHFFVGTPKIAEQFWAMGYSTSLTGVITFTDQYDEVVRSAPLTLLHAETDAPYATPKPHRGKRNEPLYVKEVYKRIAELRAEDEEVVRMQLMQNARELFGIAI